MSGLSRGSKTLNRTLLGGCSVAWWVIVIGVGILLSQLFALGHLVLVAHTRCEHGAIVHTEGHGWQQDASPLAPSDGDSPMASGGDSTIEHDHCDPFATPPAVASVPPSSALASFLEALAPLGVCASEAEHSVAILALAPKTSPTA